MRGGRGFCAGAPHGLQCSVRCQVIPRLLSLSDSSHSARSLAMGTRSTNNSMQTAPLHRVNGEENGSDAGTPSNSGSLDGLPPTSRAEAPVGDEGVSPALATFIAPEQYKLR